jgi:hypothetical protein
MDAFESNNINVDKQTGPIGLPHDQHEESSELLTCCQETIKLHAANNPMMVCAECKQIIKCFDDEKAFRNYQRFCASRHRRILATSFADRFIVVFRSYDTFTS